MWTIKLTTKVTMLTIKTAIKTANEIQPRIFHCLSKIPTILTLLKCVEVVVIKIISVICKAHVVEILIGEYTPTHRYEESNAKGQAHDACNKSQPSNGHSTRLQLDAEQALVESLAFNRIDNHFSGMFVADGSVKV
jgi:hypothetical protein